MNYIITLIIDEENLKRMDKQLADDLETNSFYLVAKNYSSTADVIRRLNRWLDTPDCILTNFDKASFSIVILPIDDNTIVENTENDLDMLEVFDGNVSEDDEMNVLNKVAGMSNKFN
jgi:hypothetical protein